jgi:putative tryptophan/tyrosine transport system substrate-binding protein
MRRREFITLLGGAVAAWPLAARAQQRAMPVIGYLYAGAPESSVHRVAAFRRGLGETGYVEGQNVTIEYRWANNQPNLLPDLAADLVRRRVAVIVSPSTLAAAHAAKAATTTIPIVFRTGVDPVSVGLVASLARPGGNITGVNSLSQELGAKRLGLLRDLVPKAERFAVLVNPNDLSAEASIKDIKSAVLALGREVEFYSANTKDEIDTAFASLVQKRSDALLVGAHGLFNNRRVQIVSLAARHAVPAMYAVPEFADIGGLISYGASERDQFRLAGIYTGRVLKGEKPADMPVLRATKLELVIHLQTAKMLGLEVPPTLLAQADEVIE